MAKVDRMVPVTPEAKMDSDDHQGGNDEIIITKKTLVDDDRMGDDELRIRQYAEDNSGPFVVCVRVRDRDKQPLESVRLTKFIRDKYKSEIFIKQVNEFKMRVTFAPNSEPMPTTSSVTTQNASAVSDAAIALARKEANSLPKVEAWNKKYRIYIPEKFVETIGCIQLSTENDIEELRSYGYGKFKNPEMPKVKILDTMRFTKIVDNGKNPPEMEQTSTVRVTFEGLLLPDAVNLFGLLIPIRQFKRRQMFCKSCLRYNHTESHCVNKRVTVAQNNVCVQCKSADHVSGDKACPRRKQLEKRDRESVKYVQRKTYAEMLQQLDPSSVMPGEIDDDKSYPPLSLGSKRQRMSQREKKSPSQQESPTRKRGRNESQNLTWPVGFRNPNLSENNEVNEDDDITSFLRSFVVDLELSPGITQMITKLVVPIISKFIKQITNSLMDKLSLFGSS